MNPFEVYQNYLALKLHFTTDYDFFKYNGKVSASINSFEKRKDKYQFLKLSKKLSDDQILEFLISNFIINKTWIGDFDKASWRDHQKTIQSLQYVFKNDLEILLTPVENFDILFNSDEGKHPRLIKAYLGKKISLETLVILEKVLQYRTRFDEQINEKFIWPKLSKLIDDYDPFLKVDVRAFRMKTLVIVQESI
jgi:hypothetical protein